VIADSISNEEAIPEENHIPVVETDSDYVLTINDEPIGTSSTSYDDVNFHILLDNGHAKSTAGKRSPMLDDGRIFYEWEFNRDVVARIAKGLDNLKIKYHIIVPEVDKDIPLSTRADRANAYCKKYGKDKCFFISVHSNAFGMGDKWETPGKWSVWTTIGVTKSDEYGKIMYDVAEEMLKPYGFGCRDGKVQGNGNEGPDYEENFTVIYKTWCPAILTENLFFTNKKECEWLMTDEGRQVIADIHIEGIKRIIESRK
jgi:N-acetylmuramoyl-L-alanine amidase